MYGDEERKMRVLRHEWGKEREKYFRVGGEGEGFGVGGGMRGVSSEDVWEQRERVIGGAFGGDYWGAVEEEERRGREGKGVEGGGE